MGMWMWRACYSKIREFLFLRFYKLFIGKVAWGGIRPARPLSLIGCMAKGEGRRGRVCGPPGCLLWCCGAVVLWLWLWACCVVLCGVWLALARCRCGIHYT